MVAKKEYLYTKEAVAKMALMYQDMTTAEVAKEFHTNHETIRLILHHAGVPLRKRGGRTDAFRVHSAAYKCVNIIRTMRPDLHDRIIKLIKEYL